MNISVFQYNIVWESPAENLKLIEDQLHHLPEDVDILVLPEMFNTGFSNHVEHIAETMNGLSLLSLKKWAQQYQSSICGSLIIQESDKYYNRFVFVTPDQEVFTYDKRHLFGMGGEDEVFSPGHRCDIIEYKGWRIKPQICYDLRFPVWSRNTERYDLLLYVANWPKLRHHVFNTLLHARALENQCYVCGSNCTGTDGQVLLYAGGSIIIDAKGQVLADGGVHNGFVSASLSLDDLRKFRTRFPFLDDADHFSLLG